MNTALIFPDLSYPWAQMGLRKQGQLIAQPYQLPGLQRPAAPLRRSPFMTKRSQRVPPTTPVCLHALSISEAFHLAGTLIDLLDVEPTVETSPLHLLPVPWERTVMPTTRVECC